MGRRYISSMKHIKSINEAGWKMPDSWYDPPDEPNYPDPPEPERWMEPKDQAFEVAFNGREPQSKDPDTSRTPWYLLMRRKAAPQELWVIAHDSVTENPAFEDEYMSWEVTGKTPSSFSRSYQRGKEHPQYDDWWIEPQDPTVSEFLTFATDLYNGYSGIKTDGPRYATTDADVENAIGDDFYNTPMAKLSPTSGAYLMDYILGHGDHMLGFEKDNDQLVNTLYFLKEYYGDKLPPLEKQEKLDKLMKTYDALNKYKKFKDLL